MAPAVVQGEQFVRVAVQAGTGAAAATPRPGFGFQARGLGGCVEGRSVARTGQEAGHPPGRGSGFPAVAGNDERRMDAMIVQAADERNYSLFIKHLSSLRRDTYRHPMHRRGLC